MLNELPPPTKAEEYQNTAEILRELAAQLRFSDTRAALIADHAGGTPRQIGRAARISA
jgi:hypothetical protein